MATTRVEVSSTKIHRRFFVGLETTFFSTSLVTAGKIFQVESIARPIHRARKKPQCVLLTLYSRMTISDLNLDFLGIQKKFVGVPGT